MERARQMEEATTNGAPREVSVDLIDCDVHPYLKDQDELREYMREPWRSRTIPSRRQIFCHRATAGGWIPSPTMAARPAPIPSCWRNRCCKASALITSF